MLQKNPEIPFLIRFFSFIISDKTNPMGKQRSNPIARAPQCCILRQKTKRLIDAKNVASRITTRRT